MNEQTIARKIIPDPTAKLAAILGNEEKVFTSNAYIRGERDERVSAIFGVIEGMLDPRRERWRRTWGDAIKTAFSGETGRVLDDEQKTQVGDKIINYLGDHVASGDAHTVRLDNDVSEAMKNDGQQALALRLFDTIPATRWSSSDKNEQTSSLNSILKVIYSSEVSDDDKKRVALAVGNFELERYRAVDDVNHRRYRLLESVIHHFRQAEAIDRLETLWDELVHDPTTNLSVLKNISDKKRLRPDNARMLNVIGRLIDPINDPLTCDMTPDLKTIVNYYANERTNHKDVLYDHDSVALEKRIENDGSRKVLGDTVVAGCEDYKRLQEARNTLYTVRTDKLRTLAVRCANPTSISKPECEEFTVDEKVLWAQINAEKFPGMAYTLLASYDRKAPALQDTMIAGLSSEEEWPVGLPSHMVAYDHWEIITSKSSLALRIRKAETLRDTESMLTLAKMAGGREAYLLALRHAVEASTFEKRNERLRGEYIVSLREKLITTALENVRNPKNNTADIYPCFPAKDTVGYRRGLEVSREYDIHTSAFMFAKALGDDTEIRTSRVDLVGTTEAQARNALNFFRKRDSTDAEGEKLALYALGRHHGVSEEKLSDAYWTLREVEDPEKK